MKGDAEGLTFWRLLMVLSSMSPLFILWAIRGNQVIPDSVFLASCALLVLVPNVALLIRIRMSIKQRETRELVVGEAEDHRDHLLVYLFAMLLPLYALETNSIRDLLALAIAIAFIVILFWHLNLHYMNVWFAFRGYRIFTIRAPRDNNPITGEHAFVIITKRLVLRSGERIVANRVSNSVYMEVGGAATV